MLSGAILTGVSGRTHSVGSIMSWSVRVRAGPAMFESAWAGNLPILPVDQQTIFDALPEVREHRLQMLGRQPRVVLEHLADMVGVVPIVDEG